MGFFFFLKQTLIVIIDEINNINPNDQTSAALQTKSIQ